MYTSIMPKCDLSTKIIPAICAWSMIIACTSLYFVFVCRYLTEEYSYAFPAVQGVISLFVMLNLYLSTFMDPGIFPRAPDDEAKDDDFRSPLYKNIEIKGVQTRMKWCTTCQFYRPPRSSHCSSCDNCIETFDHHCPWLNNCIGRRNYRYFISLLLSLCLHMVTVFAQCMFYALKHNDQLLRAGPIISIVIMIIIFLGCIPVCGLTGFHMFLISKGATTNEQVTGKFKGGPNPFSKGCFKNCCNVFCGPRWPKLLGYIPKTRTVKLDSSKITYMAAENDININVGTNVNGIRPGQSKNHNLRPQSIQEREEYHDQSSIGYDCEPSPPVKRKQQGGSYTNLFDSTSSHSHGQTVSVGASIHANNNHHHPHPYQHSNNKRSNTPPSLRPVVTAGQSHNNNKGGSFDQHQRSGGSSSGTKLDTLHHQQHPHAGLNGGSLGRRKAPIVSGEDDAIDMQGHQGSRTSPTDTNAIQSPGVHRGGRSGNGPGAQSPKADRHLPPRVPSSGKTSVPRIASPKEGDLPPPSPAFSSQRSSSTDGRPPLSPTPPGRSGGGGGREMPGGGGYSTLPSSTSSSSAVRDRARNFYPSRSRENLNRSREMLNRSREFLDRSHDSLHSPEATELHSHSQGRLGRSQDRLNHTPRGNEEPGSLRTFGKEAGLPPAPSDPYSPSHSSRSGVARGGSRDYVADSDATSVAYSETSQSYSKGKPSNRDKNDSELPHSNRSADHRDTRSRRSSDSRSRDRDGHSSRDHERQRDRDRSRSFDFDPPSDRAREKASSRERSLPRNLSESSHAGYPDPAVGSHLRSNLPPPSSSSLLGYQPQSLSGHRQEAGTVGSLGSSGARSSTLPHHHYGGGSASLPQGGPYNPASPSSSSSLASSRHPSQASSLGYHSQQEAGRPMSFVRAMQQMGPNNVDIRDRRTLDRLRRQSQSSSGSRKENTKSVYDTYEASV